MYSIFDRYILMPYFFRIKNNHVLRRLAELEKSQFLTIDQINEIQFENLKRLLVHSYNNVSFYKERFDSVGFNPHRFQDSADLKRVPCLTKKDIQNNLHKLLARNYQAGQLFADASGGSTGKPTNFFKDLYRHQIRRADQFRHDGWTGWNLGEKFVTLWGAQREFEKEASLKAKISERFIHRVFGFNAFDISEHKILEYLHELNSIRPAMIIAYANVAYLFANVIHKHNIDLSDLKLKGLISSAETLSTEKRKVIQSAFKCKVLNRYGSREVGLIASECLAQEGMHINSENVFVEIQSGGKDAVTGEMGEIIVTDLWNYGMPFIRYEMGDVGVKSDLVCSCGRGLPMLQEVTGRVSDFIVDSKDGLVHGEYFTHLFYGLEGIEQFQLIQESLDKILLKVLPGKNFKKSVLESVIAKIKLCLGNSVVVEVVVCNESMVETSGKFRFTISKVVGKF